MSKPLDGMRVAILAADGFEQVELIRPMKALHKSGAKTTLVSLRPGKIRGMNQLAPGRNLKVEQTVLTADPRAFDALLLPGGFINPDLLRQSEKALDFVRAFDQADKPIAVICHGPWLLVSAGLVRNRRLTSSPGIADDIRNAGGRWEQASVVRDGNWLSSPGPSDLFHFERALVSMFEEHQLRRRREPAPRRWPAFAAGTALLAGSAYLARRALSR